MYDTFLLPVLSTLLVLPSRVRWCKPVTVFQPTPYRVRNLFLNRRISRVDFPDRAVRRGADDSPAHSRLEHDRHDLHDAERDEDGVKAMGRQTFRRHAILRRPP